MKTLQDCMWTMKAFISKHVQTLKKNTTVRLKKKMFHGTIAHQSSQALPQELFNWNKTCADTSPNPRFSVVKFKMKVCCTGLISHGEYWHGDWVIGREISSHSKDEQFSRNRWSIQLTSVTLQKIITARPTRQNNNINDYRPPTTALKMWKWLLDFTGRTRRCLCGLGLLIHELYHILDYCSKCSHSCS